MGTPVHPTAATGGPPSPTQTAPNLVHFDPKAVVPSQTVYFQRNDVIELGLISNTANAIVTFTYRVLSPEGEIRDGLFVSPPFSAATPFTIPVYEGWLLSFAIHGNLNAVAGQWIYAQIILGRGLPNPFGIPQAGFIWQGYVQSVASNGWPAQASKESTDGAGTLRSITGTTPAAGADVSEVVPSQRRWLLISFTANLTTSAAVANRTPQAIVTDGVNTLYAGTGITNQAAATSVRYSFTNIVPSQAQIGTFFPLPIPLPIYLKSGFSIKTFTTGLQAGDQWTAPQYTVLEWLQWDA